MIKEEQHEKQLRIRYIRVLEKFLTRSNSLLKLENFDAELFKARMRKNFKDIQRVKEMTLSSPYLRNLKKYIDLVMHSIETKEEDFKTIQERLLKEVNLLQKEKASGNYKKDKHKKSKFDDEY